MYNCICKDVIPFFQMLPSITNYQEIGKLREEKGSVLSSEPISSAQRLIRLCLITGLLCQYCDFDREPELKDKSGRLLKLCQVCNDVHFYYMT